MGSVRAVSADREMAMAVAVCLGMEVMEALVDRGMVVAMAASLEMEMEEMREGLGGSDLRRAIEWCLLR